ncbi:MAG: hypothetical protein J6K89_00405 [Oscillospiraceae bacterium]|nr:hypothetical protein [Oscillospiraceae bacterium]
MNEVKVNSFLKTMAIIMLVCGILSAIVSLIGIAGVAVLAALGANSGLLYGGVALSVAGSVLQIVAGIKGIGAATNAQKAPGCVKLGIAIIALSILSNILSLIGGGELDILSIALGLVVPVLYTYSAMKK